MSVCACARVCVWLASVRVSMPHKLIIMRVINYE